jgi:RNA polymerase sigma-70 factor, ECF subfamily
MSETGVSEITVLLMEWNAGDRGARERLLPFVYDELRRQAKYLMAGERSGHTLQPTALVHEAFVRLSEQSGVEWRDRSHFYGFASRVMRQVLVDHARRVGAKKRGSRTIHFSVDEIQIPVEERAEAILMLDEVLDRLAELSPQQAQIVEMRFFGGLTNPEIAESLDVSERTVNRGWGAARLWLYRELNQK